MIEAVCYATGASTIPGSFAGGLLGSVLRPDEVGAVETSHSVSVAALTVWNHLRKCGTS